MSWSKFVVLTVALALSACSGESANNANNDRSNSNTGGKGDDTGELVGDVINGSQREVDFTQLGDPIARFILRSGTTLPETFTETIEKLNELDTVGCEIANSAQRTFLVSETAQLKGEADSYRTFTQRVCGDRSGFGLIFSVFGVAPEEEVPEGAEVMAFDESAGVFNYYEVDGGEWTFFGDSFDMLHERGGRCQSCHVSGGLVMKELDTPWLHWEGHEAHPQASDVIADNVEVLGRHGTTAATTEGIVKDGNRRWNETRLGALLADQDLRGLLRPLFCTVEVNLDNSSDFRNTPVSKFPTDAFLDPQLKLFGGDVQMSDAIYEAATAEVNQRVVDEFENVIGADTVFKMVFPERSFIDNDFVTKLKRKGVIDDAFIKDVLMVDFTRPIFSDDRCNLLNFAPVAEDLGGCCRTCSSGTACGDGCIAATSSCSQEEGCACGETGVLTPDRIRDGFIANLQAASPSEGSAAAQLLANLETTDDAGDHSARVNAYISACRARDQREFMTDAMQMLSAGRKAAARLSVFEFSATMPVDDLVPVSGRRLDPDTCELRN